MGSRTIIRRIVLPGIVYAAAAAFSIALTRVDGGIAMFWIATPLLAAVLACWPVQRWWPTLAACWVASAVVTGTVGIGWTLAPFLAFLNCGEAMITALILHETHRRTRSLVSTMSLWAALISGGILAPLLSGVLAAAMIAFYHDQSTAKLLGQWILSHGLGFLSLFPFAGLMARARMQGRPILPEKGKRLTAAASLGAVLVAGIVCFGQSSVPLLFLPILVLMYAMVLTDMLVSAAATFILVLMGIASAFVGIGPFRLMAAGEADRFALLQFYIASIALAAVPIAMQLERRRKLFATLAESEARYRMLADFSTDIIMVATVGGDIRYLSPSIRQMGIHDPAELVGQHAYALVAPQHHAEIAEAHNRVLSNPGATAGIEFLGVTRSDGLRWYESQMRGIFRDDGTPDGVCSVVRDISKRKRQESELHAVALTDQLTSLPNRRAFDIVMATMERGSGESYIAMFDLDHFSRVNEAFGHDTGDLIIKAFARAARGVLRGTDLVARMGGEEFAIHLQDTSLDQARLVCERIRAAFVYESRLAAPQVGPVSVSAGISLCNGSLVDVLQRADTALLQAKSNGRDRLAIAA